MKVRLVRRKLLVFLMPLVKMPPDEYLWLYQHPSKRRALSPANVSSVIWFARSVSCEDKVIKWQTQWLVIPTIKLKTVSVFKFYANFISFGVSYLEFVIKILQNKVRSKNISCFMMPTCWPLSPFVSSRSPISSFLYHP